MPDDFTVPTGVADLNAHELTVKQARALLLAEAQRADATRSDPSGHDRYAEGIFEDITLYEMAAICGCSIDAFDDLRESELITVADKCKKANPLFFRMRERERKRLEELMSKNPALIQQLMAKTGPS